MAARDTILKVRALFKQLGAGGLILDNDTEVSLLAQMTHRCRSLPVVGVKDPEETGSHFHDSKREEETPNYDEKIKTRRIRLRFMLTQRALCLL